MKVLHINCNYLGTALHQLMIEELDSLGIDNDVFVPTYDSSRKVIEPNGNVQVSECFNRRDRTIFDHKQHKIIEAVEDHYNIKKYDLIHAYTLFTDGNCARVLSEKYGVPYVVAVRNTDVNDFFKKMIHLRSRGIRTMKGATEVFFLSEPYREQVMVKYVPKSSRHIIETKTKVIPNGIDHFWFNNCPTASSIHKEHIKLVYAGVIDKNKNIMTTLSAMDCLENKGIEVSLTVVGRVADQSIFRKINCDKRVTYMEPVKKEELMNIYRSCDIFVMPSIHESFGLVYAEAMSQGLPVIYTKDQGFDGQFPEGTIGYHVRPDSPKDIAEKIELIVNNYDSFSKSAIEKAEKFNWGQIARDYFDIYKLIAAK